MTRKKGEALLEAIGRARAACEGLAIRREVESGEPCRRHPNCLCLTSAGKSKTIRYVSSQEHARELFGADFVLPNMPAAAVYDWITRETAWRPRP